MKPIYFALFLFLTSASWAQEGNLFDRSHTVRFADHLFKSGQYDFAAREYERLLFLEPRNDTFQLQVLRAYRLANQTDKGLQRFSEFFNPSAHLTYPFALERTKLGMNARQWETTLSFIQQSSVFPEPDQKIIQSSIFLFTDRFKEAQTMVLAIRDTTHFLYPAYRNLTEKATQGPYKKPWLAGSLSLILPGAGKAYAGQWKDGLVSLIFTAGMAFQSYRGFTQQGIRGSKGWIYGGLGLGFYLGNVYGSAKAAKQFNTRKHDAIKHETSALFTTYYP